MSRDAPPLTTIAECVAVYRNASRALHRHGRSRSQAEAQGGRVLATYNHLVHLLALARESLVELGQARVAQMLWEEHLLRYQPDTSYRAAGLDARARVIRNVLRADRAARDDRKANHG
ncbi:MAG TPA: hypothetical protein VFX53_04505 [Pedococcus sp.]|nr:hypothetical protein [Pedococcus sp.]